MKLLKALSHPFRMLRIVRFIWKARRPSTVHDMPAIVDTFWIRSGYEALTFFGTILTHSKDEADAMNGRLTTLKNHEMIHLRQAQSTGDSWLRFYTLYIWYWLKGLRWSRRLRGAAYLLNPFELEAYRHMHDMEYAQRHADGTNEWRQYVKMGFEERLKIWNGEI